MENKTIYTIYLAMSVAAIAKLPNGEEVHYTYIGCTCQEPTVRFVALNRYSRRIGNANNAMVTMGIQPGFIFKVLEQTDDVEKAEALETYYINKENGNPFNLNVVKDSAYASIAKRIKNALLGVSVAPDHVSGVAELRLNGRVSFVPYRSFDGKENPEAKKPTLLQVLRSFGLAEIDRVEYRKLARKNTKKWTTLHAAVTSSGETVESTVEETVSK